MELTVRTPVLCRRRAAVMSIPVLCTTGKLAPGASALRTPPCQPSTQLQPGVGRLLALSACRREKSSACESMWAKWDPKSKNFRVTVLNPVVSHAGDWLRSLSRCMKWNCPQELDVMLSSRVRFVCFECQPLIKL